MLYLVGMYIATIPNRKSPPAILLREAYRENGKVKNRTLANLSDWHRARIEALRRALRGDFDQAALSEPTLGPVFGLLYTLKQIADALGITAALGNTVFGKLALFLVLARLAHQGSRLSAARWAQDQAVNEVLGLMAFAEDDLYAALDDLCARQEKIELALYRLYQRRRGAQPPRLFLYDVTSSYLEGQGNELGEFGFVGDRGMVKSKGKQALEQANLHYLTALTDPQIRRLLHTGTVQLGLFHEQICEVESAGVRYVLRKNETEAAREQHRLQDKLEKLEAKIAARNEETQNKPRSQPEAGQRKLQAWAERHKLLGLVELQLEGRALVLERQQAAIETSLELAGCYVVTTNVLQASMTAQEVHDSYIGLQQVERDFRTMKTGLLEVRPVFVRKKSRTRGHVFCCMLALKLSREMERRLRAAFGTTDSDPHAITLPDALTSVSHLSLLQYQVDEKTTVTKLPQPSESQRQILKALAVTLPAK